MHGRMRTLSIGIGLSMVLAAVVAVPASARTVQVDCGGGADLQAAIAAARPGTRLMISGVCAGSFVIDKDLTLKGYHSAPALANSVPGISGHTTLRIVAGATVTVTGLRLAGLEAGDGASTILNDGVLTLRRSDVGGTGMFVPAVIYNRGSMEILRSMVGGSTRGGVPLLNEGTLTLRDSSVVGGSGSEGNVGGIINTASGTVTLERTVISGRSHQRAGGIWNQGTMSLFDSAVRDSYGREGAVVNTGRLTLHHSVVRGNHADIEGAGIWNGGGDVRLFDSVVDDNVTAGLQVYPTRGDGGGIWNGSGTVRLRDSRVRGNTGPGNGGGIYNAPGAILRLRHVTVSGNTAGLEGGGIYNDGAVTLVQVTFRSNTPNACTGC